MRKTAFQIVMARIMGFVFFLILLGIANLILPLLNLATYADVTHFFNNNLWLLFVMMVIGMVNELFWNFYFPFNFLAPLSSSVLSVFIVTFIYRMWGLVEGYVGTGVFIPLQPLQVIVAMTVLFFGYFTIVRREGMPKEEWVQKHVKKIKKMKQKFDVTADDIAAEFRLALFNIGRRINEFVEGKKKKSSKKR